MQTFKRGPISFIKSLIIAIVTGVVLYFIIGIFTENIWLIYVVPAVITLALLYMTFFSENIKFEIEGSEFRYYKKGKLRETIELTKSYIGYYIKTSDGSADHIYLLVNVDNSEEKSIDSTAIGLTKFYKMYEVMERYAIVKGDKLETKSKDGKSSNKLETKKKKVEDVVEVKDEAATESEEEQVDPIQEK